MRNQTINYNAIKKLAKTKKCTVKDLLVLAPQNDPFYVGQKSQVELAEWFEGLWNKFGYAEGVHLRRIHYQILSQDPPVHLPNGTVYENTTNAWATLDRASKAARYLGLVDPASFDDRRNGRPTIFEPCQPEEPQVLVNANADEYGFEFPKLPFLPSYSMENFEGEQSYHIEIWAEKSTMNDVLLPLCEQHGVNLITGLGELKQIIEAAILRYRDSSLETRVCERRAETFNTLSAIREGVWNKYGGEIEGEEILPLNFQKFLAEYRGQKYKNYNMDRSRRLERRKY